MLWLAGKGHCKLLFTLMTAAKNRVLNVDCKAIWSFRGVLLWLGFSSPLSHCHLTKVEQMSLPSYLWKKGNNFMPLTVQGKPWAPLSAESLLTQVHNPHTGTFTLLPDTSSCSQGKLLQVLAHSNGNHLYVGHCDLPVLYRCCVFSDCYLSLFFEQFSFFLM